MLFTTIVCLAFAATTTASVLFPASATAEPDGDVESTATAYSLRVIHSDLAEHFSRGKW